MKATEALTQTRQLIERDGFLFDLKGQPDETSNNPEHGWDLLGALDYTIFGDPYYSMRGDVQLASAIGLVQMPEAWLGAQKAIFTAVYGTDDVNAWVDAEDEPTKEPKSLKEAQSVLDSALWLAQQSEEAEAA